VNLGIKERSLSRYLKVSSSLPTSKIGTYMSVTMSEEDLEQLDDFFD